MSARLDSARALHEQGDDSKALKELWRAHGESPANAEALTEILLLAEAISDQSEGRRARDADMLATATRNSLGNLARPIAPATPHYREGMPVTTANELPGYQITEYVGEVFGIVVRSRGAFPAFGAQLKSLVGGELKTMTNLLEQARGEAVERMVERAADRGADAVIAMRFDAETMADQWSRYAPTALR
jgi:uncharacterized protein YbjQ (UPF0145 family)